MRNLLLGRTINNVHAAFSTAHYAMIVHSRLWDGSTCFVPLTACASDMVLRKGMAHLVDLILHDLWGEYLFRGTKTSHTSVLIASFAGRHEDSYAQQELVMSPYDETVVSIGQCIIKQLATIIILIAYMCTEVRVNSLSYAKLKFVSYNHSILSEINIDYGEPQGTVPGP